MATLRITGGPDVGTTFDLRETQIIGRLARNEIPMKDAAASRQHARLWRQDGAFWLADLNSANGITIDGRAVTREVLPSGSRFRIGQTIFEINYEEQAPAPARSPAAKPSAGSERPRPRASGATDPEVTTRGDSMDRVLKSKAGVRQGGKPDLGQLTAEKRWLVYLLGAAMAIGLGYLSFALTGGR